MWIHLHGRVELTFKETPFATLGGTLTVAAVDGVATLARHDRQRRHGLYPQGRQRFEHDHRRLQCQPYQYAGNAFRRHAHPRIREGRRGFGLS